MINLPKRPSFDICFSFRCKIRHVFRGNQSAIQFIDVPKYFADHLDKLLEDNADRNFKLMINSENDRIYLSTIKHEIVKALLDYDSCVMDVFFNYEGKLLYLNPIFCEGSVMQSFPETIRIDQEI